MVACWVILLQQENWNASWENLMLGVSARRWWACQAAACGMAWQGCLQGVQQPTMCGRVVSGPHQHDVQVLGHI